MANFGRPRLRPVQPQQEPAPEVPALPGPGAETPEIAHISVRSGDRLLVEQAQRAEYDFQGGSYYLMSRELSAKLPFLGLNATQYDLLHHMMGTQERGGAVRQTQAQLAQTLGIHRTEVVKAMRLLLDVGLIWQEKRGVYRINPRCAFYGRGSEQIQAVRSIPASVPELNLPAYDSRPPRRKRELKGVQE